jgi:2-oxoglutarate ferredoxin oxidoreductase subunit beta
VTKSTPFGSLDHPFNPVSLALGADATFVARTIDSDRKHLTSVIREAADHQGAAFIEIYQNCPIFNDDAFAPLKDTGAAERLVRLEHGQPVANGSTGIRFGTHGELEACPAHDAIVHDAHRTSPSYAFALSRLDSKDFKHTPIGVFRKVEQASYDQLMAEQIAAARVLAGPGDLSQMLIGKDSWQSKLDSVSA